MTHTVKFRTEDGALHDHRPRGGVNYFYALPEGRPTSEQIDKAEECPVCWPARAVAAKTNDRCIDCARVRAGGIKGKGAGAYYVGQCVRLDRTLARGTLPPQWPTVRLDTDTCENFKGRP